MRARPDFLGDLGCSDRELDLAPVDGGAECALTWIEISSDCVEGGVFHDHDHHGSGEHRREDRVLEPVREMFGLDQELKEPLAPRGICLIACPQEPATTVLRAELRGPVSKASGSSHPKRGQPVEHRRAFVLDGTLRIEMKAGEPFEQQGNGDLRLSAGKRRSKAEMRSAAKGEMARVRPFDIEAVRIGVPRWVMAGREKRHGHYISLLHLGAAHFKRLKRYPRGLHHGWVVP